MSFRSALLASAAILTAGSAFAADLPARVAAPAPYYAAPVFTWTGFYVGLNAGAGWNKNSSWDSTFSTGYGSFGGNDAGFTGGAQAGYNMQFGSFVAGVEADINYIDRGNSGSATYGTSTQYYTISRGDSNNWFGTLRGRLGFAFDRALIYGTGGLAFGGKNGGSSVTYTDTQTPANSYTLSRSGGDNNSVGWTLGGGVEYAFTNSMSVKLEYLHVKLGDNNRTFVTSGGANAFYIKNDNKFDVVRAGVNFRF